ncbi:MAG TPA: hypothetical protein VGD91_29320 [Trebonia sp.]
MSDNEDDLMRMPDPEFLAERKRVREALENLPEPSADLSIRHQRLSEAFIRRARISWSGSEQ